MLPVKCHLHSCPVKRKELAYLPELIYIVLTGYMFTGTFMERKSDADRNKIAMDYCHMSGTDLTWYSTKVNLECSFEPFTTPDSLNYFRLPFLHLHILSEFLGHSIPFANHHYYAIFEKDCISLSVAPIFMSLFSLHLDHVWTKAFNSNFVPSNYFKEALHWPSWI